MLALSKETLIMLMSSALAFQLYFFVNQQSVYESPSPSPWAVCASRALGTIPGASQPPPFSTARLHPGPFLTIL